MQRKRVLAVLISLVASPALAATYVWDCDGVVSNAYLETSPEYHVVRTARHVIHVSCPMLHSVRGVACEASIDGMLDKDVWYDENNLTYIDSLGIGGAQFDARTGFITYKITEGNISNTAETQLWFSAHCTKR